MYRGESRYFRVVYQPDRQYAIWHAEAPTHRCWLESGHYGSESECWDYIDEQDRPSGFIFHFPAGR